MIDKSASCFIGGAWHKGDGEVMSSTDPSSGGLVWSGHAASEDQVSDAAKAARAAFPDWSMDTYQSRMDVINAYRDLLVSHKDDLAKLIARETGKPLWDALGEAGAMAGKIDISVKAYQERTGSRESVNGAMRSVLKHRAHGVMAVFGPYNFPGHLPNGHIVPALIAGNSVVFKPSELTPGVAHYMAQLWQEAGLPSGVLNIVQGGRDTGIALSQSPDIDGLLFTGSADTGRAISRQLGERPEVILALEMGGNNPLIVHEVADQHAAAMMTILSAYITSGQRCTCARRLIVPAGDEGDAFLEGLQHLIRKIKVGAWDDEEQPFMGPVISSQAAGAVLKAQQQLMVKGATPLILCEQLDRGAAFLSPGLIDVTGVSALPDEEVFGPLLQVIRVPDIAGALDAANATRFGLAAGILTDNRDHFDYFYPRVRAGIVNWNQQLTGAASTSPFGGPGWSGNHRPSAYYAADYCAFPVASIEHADGKVALANNPIGIDE